MPIPGFQFLRIRTHLLITSLFLAPLMLIGQVDSMMTLREIEVTADRIDLTDIGKHSDALDSHAIHLIRHDNLASILVKETPLYVRTYGNGTLATLGIRGGSASHTQLLWNGIPIRNPMIGMVDLAMIPSAFIDQAAVHYGGHGAAFGSGAVGGLISLSNDAVSLKNSINVHLSTGSWENRIGEIKLNYGFQKVRFSTRGFSQFAENNYNYKLDQDSPERQQVHHQLKNLGLLQEINWTINQDQQLTARLWYQYADRQIPPTSTQTTSTAAQQDESLRISLQWMKKGEKINWQVKSALLDETIDYQDSMILLYTQNQFRTWLAEGEASWRINQSLSFAGGLYSEIVRAESANYLEATSRYQNAMFASLRLIKSDWLYRIQMREEVTDQAWSPLLVDISAEWSGLELVTLKSSLSRNYRIPTLNDLYWRPGGNSDLVPEQGWTFEAGIYYAVTGKKNKLSSSLTGFTRKIEQWIMWMPPVKDVSLYWSPINVAEVNSHGIEARGNYGLQRKKWVVDLTLGLDLTWSTFGAPLPDFGIMEGDQLFFVPVENLLGGLRTDYLQWSGYYHHRWFGDSPGINEDVEAGNVGSAGLSYKFNPARFKGTLYLQLDNIWNVPYRVIERRPMPGRSVMVGVRISFT